MCIDASGRIGSGRVLFSLFSRSMRRQRERGGSGPKTTRRRGGGGGACWWSGQIEVFSVHEKAARGRANLWGRPQREAWRGEPRLARGGPAVHTHWYLEVVCPSREGRRVALVGAAAGWGRWWWSGHCWSAGRGSRCPDQPLGKGHSSPVQFSPVVLAWLLARSAARAPSRSGADC